MARNALVFALILLPVSVRPHYAQEAANGCPQLPKITLLIKGSIPDHTPEKGTRLGTVRFEQGADVSRLAFSPDGKMLAAGAFERGPVHLWDLATGKCLCTLATPEIHTMQLGFSPDGELLARCFHFESYGVSAPETYGRIQLWEVKSGRKLQTVPGSGFAFSPDRKTLAITEPLVLRKPGADGIWYATPGKTVRLLELPSCKELRVFPQAGACFAPMFSPDGKTLAFADESAAHLVHPATGKERRRLEGFRGEQIALSFSANGETLIGWATNRNKTASPHYGGTVYLWNVSTGALQGSYALAVNDPVFFGKFSPDGNTFLLADRDRIRVLNAATGQEISQVVGIGKLFTLAYSSDSATVALSYAGGTIAIWHPGSQ